jgi:ubiquinone/menaquinone biosynthesis C-methylase UbiE
MAVGREPALVRARGERGVERFIQVVYGRAYGDPDLHTHIRWRAIRRHIIDTPQTVDIACGDGTITLEAASALPGTSIRGIDLNAEGIAIAEQRRQDTNVTNVTFEVGDANDLRLGTVGQALLLDVLEHVDDDAAVLASVGRAMKPCGRVVVSTPTPQYPKFFGREFHEAVGHVRDGYTLPQMSRLLDEAGFDVETATYYTRLPASIACAAFYRSLWKRGRVGIALSPLLNAISFLDAVWPWTKRASSLLVVGIKR